ncbi:MAG: hypothetical protein J5764_04600 [Bacteroidales bacterium]|nr:hypothetical protein [Bacteroidales bacterium]
MDCIDVVLPWVDGSDSRLAALRAEYAEGNALTNDEVGGETRYASIGEIKYCVASVFRFAPFVRKVFIVTDGQDPGLRPMLEEHFPERVDDVVIVDHKVIFRGREEFLPTFNSNSIDTLIWNIPELSERFVYLNDDYMLIAPVCPSDFFRGDKVVCYGEWFPAWWERILRSLRPGHVGFKVSMLRALELSGGGRRFVNLGHAPCPMFKSWHEDWARLNPEKVCHNLRYKFRHRDQYEAQEMFYLEAARRDKLCLIDDRKAAFYFKRRNTGNYVSDKLRAFDAVKTRKFVCFNSLNQCTPDEISQVLSWLDKRIFG